MLHQILAIDNILPTFNTLKREWEKEGAILTHAANVRSAVKRTPHKLYHLIVLVSRQEIDEVIDMIRILREDTRLPILVLTEKYSAADKLTAINAGADDYLPLSEDVREAAASSISLIRRQCASQNENRGGLFVDSDCHMAIRDGIGISLTAMEFNLLDYFACNPNQYLSPLQIFENVWGSLEVNSSKLTSRIHRLRVKIEPNPREPVHIVSKYRVGYFFQPKP